MNTLQIESLANRGNIAKADFNIKTTLRRLVIPRFLLQVDNVVGQVHWRRKTLSLDFTTSDRDKDLPTDFDRFDEVYLASTASSTGLESEPLDYIGEIPENVLKAEVATTAAKPTAYYIVAGDTNPFGMKMAVPLDQNYTAKGVYFRLIPFTDDVTEVDLDDYIPWQYQAAIVHLLRAEIYADRYGFGDQRYTEEKQRGDEFIAMMAVKKEPAPRNRAVFAR
jgi:hypothetical protein